MPTLIYIYDALCGWCYGFTPVMQQLEAAYRDKVAFDVLSGGMVPPEHAQPVRAKASYIAGAYKTVEEYTGIQFGEAYLHHIFYPERFRGRNDADHSIRNSDSVIMCGIGRCGTDDPGIN